MANQPTNAMVHQSRPLTNYALQALQSAGDFVAMRAFPTLSVRHASDTYYTFTDQFFRTDTVKPRAPGDVFPEDGWELSTANYATVQYALATSVADEIRANADDPLRLDIEAVDFLAQKALIHAERHFSANFMATGVWGTSNTTATDWDDYSASDPVNDVLVAKRTVQQNTGQRANVLVMGRIVEDALSNHPDMLERTKYLPPGGVTGTNVVRNALAAALDVSEILVSGAIYDSAAEGGTASNGFIVDDDCLLMVRNAPGIRTFTAGMTIVWQPGGGQGVIETVRDDDRKRDVHRFMAQWDMVKIAAAGGYFFSDIV